MNTKPKYITPSTRPLFGFRNRKCERCDGLFVTADANQWICEGCVQQRKALKLPPPLITYREQVVDYDRQRIAHKIRVTHRGKRATRPNLQPITQTLYVCMGCRSASTTMHGYHIHRGKMHPGSSEGPELVTPEES